MFCAKESWDFILLESKVFYPPPQLCTLLSDIKRILVQNISKSTFSFETYMIKNRSSKVLMGGQKLLIRKVWYNIPAFFCTQNYINWQFDLGNFQLKHGIRFLWIYFHWKSHLPYFTKSVSWVFCRPQRGKWNSMGCIKSISEILKFFAKSTIIVA